LFFSHFLASKISLFSEDYHLVLPGPPHHLYQTFISLKKFIMKFLSMLCLLWLTLPELAAQSLADRQERFNACLSGHSELQNRIQAERLQSQENLVAIRESVMQLIKTHEVRVAGTMLELKDLRSTVELSMQLRDLDAECDSIYAQLREGFWPRRGPRDSVQKI